MDNRRKPSKVKIFVKSFEFIIVIFATVINFSLSVIIAARSWQYLLKPSSNCNTIMQLITTIIPVQLNASWHWTFQKCCSGQSKFFPGSCTGSELLTWTSKWLSPVATMGMTAEMRYCVEFFDWLCFILLLSPGASVRCWGRKLDTNRPPSKGEIFPCHRWSQPCYFGVRW